MLKLLGGMCLHMYDSISKLLELTALPFCFYKQPKIVSLCDGTFFQITLNSASKTQYQPSTS